MALQISKKTIPLKGISISIEDVKRIVERLLPHVEEEGHREVDQLLSSGPYDQERHAQLNFQREQAFRITVTIFGRDGENLFGYGTEPFNSLNIPTPIESIYISNVAAFQTVAGRSPLNNFILNLDFSAPPLVDNNNPVSNPTPNFSHLTVEGDRNTWVPLIQDSVMDVIGKKLNRRSLLHAAFVYDVGLWLLGFPAAIYACWRSSKFVEAYVGVHNSFISVAAYVYIAFLVLILYRIVFGYAKWAFPIVELADNEDRSKTHRKVLLGILLTLIGSAIYDLLFLIL